MDIRYQNVIISRQHTVNLYMLVTSTYTRKKVYNATSILFRYNKIVTIVVC